LQLEPCPFCSIDAFSFFLSFKDPCFLSESFLSAWFLLCSSDAAIGSEPPDLSSSSNTVTVNVNVIVSPVGEMLQQLMVRTDAADKQLGEP
jgi:hypothetical protein